MGVVPQYTHHLIVEDLYDAPKLLWEGMMGGVIFPAAVLGVREVSWNASVPWEEIIFQLPEPQKCLIDLGGCDKYPVWCLHPPIW